MRSLFYIIYFCSFTLAAQSVNELDSLLEIGQSEEADRRIQRLFQQLEKSGKEAQLPDFLEVFGRIQLSLHPDQTAMEQVDNLIDSWEKMLILPTDHKELWRAASSWYEYMGMLQQAYQAQLKAYDYAKTIPQASLRELGMLQVNLGAYAVNTMDIPTAKKHLLEAQRLLEKDPDPESIYRLNSYLGNMAYFASKLDSAEYYYQKCLNALSQTVPSARNSFYRPALIYNNLSGVQMAQGKTTDAIESMNMTISKLLSYTETETDPSLMQSGREFYFQALDNLGGAYKELGNYRKAQHLLEFSYQGKKAELSKESKDVMLSEILLGQLYFDQGEPEKARSIILKGLKGLENSQGMFVDYQADGWYALARIEDQLDNRVLAENYYRKAQRDFQEVFGEEFDLIYLGFIRDFSLFLAKNKAEKEAIQIATEAFDYLKENLGSSSLKTFEQALNIGEVQLVLGNFKEASYWGNQALNVLGSQLSDTSSLLDSIQNERHKPQAILLTTKSEFLATSDPSTEKLTRMIKEMEEGLEIIERRKTFLEAEEDVALLLSEHNSYYRFLEQLYLEIYDKSSQQEYLERLLILHESALYHKVRSRLDQLDIARFGSIPPSFFAEEKRLKDKIRLTGDLQNAGIGGYLALISDWEEFLQQARINYPQYYEFRYASLEHGMNDIWENIPEKTTVVRYLLIGNKLGALVLSKEDKTLSFFELDASKSKLLTSSLQTNWNDKAKTFSNLQKLYKGLWEPLQSQVKTERILIVPDGFLFNLSYELLTPTLLQDYSELSQNSLLSKHSISYHYSTLLYQYPEQKNSYQSNFVAFAPGFFDEMKEEYLTKVKDSFQIDRSYLTLLPQPFTDRLVDRLKKLLGGKVYSQQASTLDQFTQEAGKHRILHIGTHAESDNLSPEFSRLIFAKSATNEENSLYAKDIYQMDLSSELAVLLACETGKPSYQPGEGMISLAHAFNYAGSKSMLTGLWKIDEEASAKIATSFYEYLAEGENKDKALRQAKLDYLSMAQGRSLSPEFWAGLIVLGDSDPIILQATHHYWWLYGALAFLLLTIYLLTRNKQKPKSTDDF